MDARTWLAELRDAYARSLTDGAAHWKQAEQDLVAGRLAPEALAEAALTALETMGDGDPTSWGMTAADVLARHGSPDLLDRLRACRPSLPARPGLRDWRTDADRAIAVLTLREAGICDCAAEAREGATPYTDRYIVDSTEVDQERWCTRYTVRCASCGAGWNVREQQGYHYPIFEWTPRD